MYPVEWHTILFKSGILPVYLEVQVMKSIWKKGLGVAVLAVVPSLALAGPGYDYLDFGYINFEPSGGNKRDGVGGALSISLSEHFHAVGEFAGIDSDQIRNEATRLALGYNRPFNERTDFVVRAGWAWQDTLNRTQFPRAEVERDGIALDAGVRNQLTDDFELSAFVRYANVGGGRGGMSVEAVRSFGDQVGIFAGLDFASSAYAGRIGVRFHFGESIFFNRGS